MMTRPITQEGRYATRPTVYTCYPYAAHKSQRPALFVLINASHAKTSGSMLPAQVDEALAKWGIRANNISLREVYTGNYIEQ